MQPARSAPISISKLPVSPHKGDPDPGGTIERAWSRNAAVLSPAQRERLLQACRGDRELAAMFAGLYALRVAPGDVERPDAPPALRTGEEPRRFHERDVRIYNAFKESLVASASKEA
jgi:hypothetical protein